MKKLLLALAVVLSINSCTKKTCEKNNTGTATIQNHTMYKYQVRIDGNVKGVVDQYANFTSTNITEGNHFLEAYFLDLSGLPYLRAYSGSITVVQCEDAAYQLN